MPGEPIAPGGVLEFTLNGLPSTDSTGRNVAGVLTLMLIAGAFVFGRRPKGGGQGGVDVAAATRDRLVDQRESTFAELVALERTARARGRRRRRPPTGASSWSRSSSRSTATWPRWTNASRHDRRRAAALRLSKVGKIYDGRRALADVSATFEPGRIAAVLGPNGAGKSTLLGILSTLIAPSAGEVRWGDERLGRGSSLRARIGYVGHEPGLYGDLDRHREPDAVRLALRRRRSAGARGGAARAGGPRRCAVGRAGADLLARDDCSGWRWRARWSTTRRCCCSTSRPPRSIRRAPTGWRPSSPPSGPPAGWWCW